MTATPNLAGHTRDDAYAILGLEHGASVEEIQRSYRKRILRAHPDRGGSNKEFIRVYQAYKTLINDQNEWQDDNEDWDNDDEESEGDSNYTEWVLSRDKIKEMIAGANPPESTRTALLHRSVRLAMYRVLDREEPKAGPGVESVGLDDRIVKFLKRRKITQFFDYQFKAIGQILGHKSVVIEAPTAFGKTEAFLVPIAHLVSLMPPGKVRALFVYPTKALGRDQLKKIADLAGALDREAAIFDGDTMINIKNSLVRDPPEFLVTNFDTIHKQMSMHNQLAGMLDSVEFLVVDEAHYYAGVFGANAHHIIFRLKRFTGTLQCIGASATLNNSDKFCSDLFGQPVSVIKETGRRSKVDMAIMAPPEGVPKHWLMVDLAKIITSHKKKVMVFSNTHRNVELVGREAKLDRYKGEARRLPLGDQASKQAPERLDGLRAEIHRGGLDKNHLEAVEEAFGKGKLNMLSCTPTLELGVDIGDVDGVISEGVPANRFMQRIGRAVRDGERGCAFLVLGGDPISRYYLENPAEFTQDEWVPNIDITNPDIKDIHTIAAAMDSPIERHETAQHTDSIRRCMAEKLIERADQAWRATERGIDKVTYHNIRGIEKSVSIQLNRKTIGRRSLPMALSELHEGAIYMLGGEPYRVEKLDYPRPMRAIVAPMPRNTRERTKALGQGWATEIETIESRTCLGTDVGLCRLRIKQTINGYAHYTKSGIEYKSLDRQLSHKFDTKGIKFRVIPHGVATHGEYKDVYQESFHAIEHLVANASRMMAGAAESDVGSVLSGGGLIYIYDNVRGGNGIAGILYDRTDRVFQRAYDIVAGCPCKKVMGCPRCTLSYRCRLDNVGLDKDGAKELLAQILGSKAALRE